MTANRILSCIFAIFLAWPSSADAFYKWHHGEKHIDFDGFIDLAAAHNQYPSDNFLYSDTSEDLWAYSARLLVTGQPGKNTNIDIDILQYSQKLAAVTSSGPSSASLFSERSSLLAIKEHASINSESYLEVDSLYLQWLTDVGDITLGRQPISLATTLYFSPNDFFSPFSAQTFFRTYKAGVDAIRTEISLGELTQLSLFGVLSYRPDADKDTGWSQEPDWQSSSALARFITSYSNFEWGIMGGTVKDRRIYGGSIQGEIFNWLGVRAEGHYSDPEDAKISGAYELAAGIEHRFKSSLDMRLEYFYHGQGDNSIETTNFAPANSPGLNAYRGKNYTAFGLSYEPSPLLNASFLTLINWSDSSQLYSLYGVYSLADEAEFAITITAPNGDKPDQKSINSEFGSAPTAISVDLRQYF